MEARQRDRGGPLDLVAASDTFKEPLALDDDHYTLHGLAIPLLWRRRLACSAAFSFSGSGRVGVHGDKPESVPWNCRANIHRITSEATRVAFLLAEAHVRGIVICTHRLFSCTVSATSPRYHAAAIFQSRFLNASVLTFDYHRNDFQRKKLTESAHPSPVPILIPFLLFYYRAASVSACSVYSTSDVLPASLEFITPPPPATMSTRAPPLRAEERPPAYRMVTRVYNNSLRPFVIVIGSVVAIWSLAWAIPSFQDINEDKSNGQPKFAVFDIVLGTIYATACAIEVFGVIAAATQRLFMVRIYAVLSLVGSLAVVAAGFMRVVLHFVFKVRVLAASPRARMAD
ncbi:hypothetical protein NUW54_g11610 [Trametes sanguinea]|uniref:Uncharacterized protein n=1 Tax=Trametes sanguinea TaxID=158606 RepID=A0ACC1NB78_9APHY|nr:hypothetical protein NUW54_g11610 [Trametes sanguinea]